jgi:hypothetical protein
LLITTIVIRNYNPVKLGRFNEVAPALYILILIGSLTGTLTFGLATISRHGIEHAVGWLFLLASLTILFQAIAYYRSQTWLGGITAHLQPITLCVLLPTTAVWLYLTPSGSGIKQSA